MTGLGCRAAYPHERNAFRHSLLVSAPRDVSDAEIPPTLGAMKWLAVNDQRQFNSCCGNATDKVLEWDAWAQMGYASKPPDLSARASYLFGREWAGVNDGPDNGLSIEAGAMGSKVYGTVEESQFPYWQGRFDPTIPESVKLAANRYRVNAVTPASTSREIVQRLGTGQAATLFGIAWTTSLAAYDGREPIRRDIGGRVVGGHALAVCDYETIDGGLFLRVWNSHGQHWGDRGTMLVSAELFDRWLLQSPYGAFSATGLTGFVKRPFQWSGGMA